jgi:beta-galactosidase
MTRSPMWLSLVMAAALFAPALDASAQGVVHEIDISAPAPHYRSEHLNGGNQNAQGQSIAVNEYYLSIDGQPAIPVTGEFHFYRYPRAYWEEELLKMKAGGVNIVATYVHWIVHEEREGVFDWSGDRDLRAFVDLCARLNMRVILRVGPFGHGEVRSGGFPDWLLGRPLTVRSNDPEYLRYVARLFNEVGQQVRGRFFSDGGPIIAVQVENEYQHSASPWALNYPGQAHDWTVAPSDQTITRQGVGVAIGANIHSETGVAHMRRLRELIEQAGMRPPIWTATGWGNATIIPNVTLPVTAGYAYPSWEPAGVPSSLYLYRNLRATPDYQPISYNGLDYPYFASEIGVGIPPTYTRRPVVPAESVEALVNRFLGGGANVIGYYMFQGGSTPRGERVFYSDEAYGYPKISYDYQAPLGEFGEVRPSFHRLKLMHYFMAAFGDRLAPAPVVLPANAESIEPANVADLRFAARGADGVGFIFLNNFQDHVTNRDHAVQLSVRTPAGNVRIPDSGSFTLHAGQSAILPVNFDLDGATLISATAQPLTRISGEGGDHFVFFALDGVEPEFVFSSTAAVTARAGDGCRLDRTQERARVRCAAGEIARFDVATPAGGTVHVVSLDHRSALNSWVAPLRGKEHLLITPAIALSVDGGLRLSSVGDNSVDLSIYPALASGPQVSGPGSVRAIGARRGFARYQVRQAPYTPTVTSLWVAENKLVVDLPARRLPAGVSDVWLGMDYLADTVLVFQDGELIGDTFYQGLPWTIGMKRFLEADGGAEMLFYFRPLQAGLPFYPDLPSGAVPSFAQGERVIRVRSLTATPEYETSLVFGSSRTDGR